MNVDVDETVIRNQIHIKRESALLKRNKKEEKKPIMKQ